MSMIRDLRTVVRRSSDASVAPKRHSCVVDCAVYRDGARVPGEFHYDSAIREVRDSGEGFVWIGLFEPTEAELAGIAERFELHPLAVEDAVHAHQRPKLERYDDMLFVVFKTVRYVEPPQLTATSEVVESGEIMVFLGQDFVITVRHGEHGDLRSLRRRLEGEPELLAYGPSAVLYAVADRAVDDYLEVTGRLQDDIDEVENAVFSPRRATDPERLYQLKREVMELKRAVAPLARPLRTLAERPIRLVHPDIREYFRDVDDHLARVAEDVQNFDELLTSIVQANLAQITVAQNEDMRKISAWVAIVAVPTMVFGIYGMNFEYMPELKWRFGYPLVLAITFTICLLMHRGFRKNGWL
ncbi:magnesium and cobalt transport protein CorA [Carbonactinospora thermoautotrophica]|uniref:magnesium/cobalt transporter CorA n=1 Tax=Carbonactinospora thermoautotrophica TaxID=1469144 RepID=UPI002270EB65|nr:magnesium/cobalt transporter CorA [Carbonactinospora thermoautotrophica]MCX9192576.1 magnesium and cobalt transport protein CorA [Carbonactinospora thermoautotrophica]